MDLLELCVCVEQTSACQNDIYLPHQLSEKVQKK